MVLARVSGARIVANHSYTLSRSSLVFHVSFSPLIFFYFTPTGPWEEVTPESQGLSADALAAAASSVSNVVAGRKCFVVRTRNVILGRVKTTFIISSPSPLNISFISLLF